MDVNVDDWEMSSTTERRIVMSKGFLDMSKAEQEAAFAKFQRLQANEQKAAERAKRLRVKNALLVEKAKASGIEVSDREIDEYIAKM